MKNFSVRLVHAWGWNRSSYEKKEFSPSTEEKKVEKVDQRMLKKRM
jgi:hypothetical protein